MKYKLLKAFIAGIALPAIVLPFVLLLVWYVGRLDILETMPIYLILLAWAIWNVVYFAVGRKCPIRKQNLRLMVHGAILGLGVAVIGVFVFDVAHLLFGITGPVRYTPLLLAPVIYSLLWRYVIKYLDKVVGLKDKNFLF